MRYVLMVAVVTFLAGEAHGRGFGGPRAGAARGGSYTGPRGTTVQAGRAAGVGVGPLGGVHAGAASGARVTTPGGRTVATGQRAGVSVGPAGGVRAGASRGTVASGYRGTMATGSRAGVAVGPGGRVAAGGYRGGVGVGPLGGMSAGGVRVGGYAGPRGVAVAGHSTRYVSSSAFHSRAAVIRTGGGYGYTCFTPNWYRVHTVAWRPVRWATPTFWVAPAWPSLVTWCGVRAAPIAYDYGGNVVINENNVYVNGEQTASATDYADQATSLADAGRRADPPREDEWRSLGVFGLVQGDEEVAQNMFQLAINKAGVVRGNYYDALADNTLNVYGSLDKKTQRLAWSIGEKKEIVFETGLNNLTKDETTVLVHYGKDRTRQMALVRIEQPDDKK
jgi:hypothetical protein